MTIIEQIEAFSKRSDHESRIGVTAAFFKAVLKLIRRLEAEARRQHVCPFCEQPGVFDVVGHVSAPSRDEGNPLAAAAAVNISRRSAL